MGIGVQAYALGPELRLDGSGITEFVRGDDGAKPTINERAAALALRI